MTIIEQWKFDELSFKEQLEFTGTVVSDSETTHYVNGKYHCETGPAVIYTSGSSEYYLNDERVSKEEFESKFNSNKEADSFNDKILEIDSNLKIISLEEFNSFSYPEQNEFSGVVIDSIKGAIIYRENGLMSRIDGPARIYANGTEEYWHNGIMTTKEAVEKLYNENLKKLESAPGKWVYNPTTKSNEFIGHLKPVQAEQNRNSVVIMKPINVVDNNSQQPDELINSLTLIKDLTLKDNKTAMEKLLKTMEELGEVSRALLTYNNSHGTNYRLGKRDDVLEELADTLMCLYSVAYKLEFTNQDLHDMILQKCKKWEYLIEDTNRENEQ